MDMFWEKEDWELEDLHLGRLAKLPFQRPFPFIPERPGLYLVRGPRQVGKSSWLKSVLSHATQKGISCFYLSCENIADNQELAEILKSVRDRKIVLLDEVSFVEKWDRAVKHELDFGKIPVLMVTGSHAYDLKQGADRMPGRFGAGTEYHLLPMDFEEFHQMRTVAGWAESDRLAEIRAYFQIGGFPAVVAAAGKSGTIPKEMKETYLRWLIGDIEKLGKNERYLKELLAQIALCTQTPLSFQTLAKKTSISTHDTVQDYLSVLESCFAIRILYAMDQHSGSYRFKKNKKIYFTDPIIYWLSLELLGNNKTEQENEAAIAEMVAHEALSRRFSRFGYLQGTSGEVDFCQPQRWAVELKWSPIPTNLSKAYKNLLIPNKIVWTHSNFLKEWPTA